MMKKIIYVAPADSIHSFKWINYLSKSFDGYWISLSPLRFDLPSNIEFYSPRENLPEFLRVILAIFKCLVLKFKNKTSVLQIHSLGIYGFIGFMTFCYPKVATAWGSDVLVNRKFFFKRLLLKFFLKNADVLTCDADHMIDAIKQLSGRVDTKLIKFGVDVDKFNPNVQPRDLLKLYGVGSKDVVVSLRNFHKIYSIETLIMAIPLVVLANPNAHFILIGSGPEEGFLRKLSVDLKIDQHVTFAGSVQNDDLPGIINACSAYVSTSLSDGGIAASTAEAMSCGLPVVITNNLDNSDWVSEGVSGFLFDPLDFDTLAEKIINVLDMKYNQPNAVKCMSVAARNKIVRDNNFANEMDSVVNIYNMI